MAKPMQHLCRHVTSPIMLLFLFSWLAIFTMASAKSFCITPHNDTTFSGESPCMTLSEVAAEQNMYMNSNTYNIELILEPGNHVLEIDFLVSTIVHFSMCGNCSHASDQNENLTVITCLPEAKFALTDIHSVHISGVLFIDCFGSTVSNVNQFTFENSIMQNHINSCTTITTLQLNFVEYVNIQLSSFSMSIIVEWPFSTCSSSEIETNSSVTIIGINACSNVTMSSIFIEDVKMRDSKLVYISNGSNVTVEDSLFINNTANSSIMFYVVESALSVRQCEFKKNTYLSSLVPFTSSSGETIVAAFSYIEIESTKFLNEMTEMNTLIVQNGTLILNNCSFLNNIARSPNMSTVFSLQASVLIYGSSFAGNRAGHAGVLIAIQSSVTIVQSVFHNNSAYAGSGALLIYSSLVSIENCAFIKNIAYRRKGGVFSISNSRLIMTDSLFSLNLATDGGALDAISSHITIESTVFNSNKAVVDSGGAVYVSNSTLLIHSSDFYNNSAIHGGAMFIVSSKLILNNSNLILNKAEYRHTVIGGMGKRVYLPINPNGGAVYAQLSSINVIGSNFRDNSASVSVRSTLSLTQMDCDPLHSKNYTTATILTKLAAYGGALYTLRCNTVMIDHTTFVHNLIHVDGNVHHNICTFFDYPGGIGGVLSSNSDNTMIIKKSEFIANRVHIGYTILLQSLQRSYEYALAYGSVMGIGMNKAVSINESVFRSNSANFEAPNGAIYVLNCSVEISNSLFHKNIAGINHYPQKLLKAPDKNPTTNCTTCHIDDNGVYSAAMLAEISLVTISNCTFLENIAYSGFIVGAIVNSYLAISDCNFTQNTVDSSQYVYGVVSLDTSAARISNSKFEKNEEGALTVSFSVLELNNCSFANNSGNFAGVCLLALRSILSLNNTTFTDNKLYSFGRNDTQLESVVFQILKSSPINNLDNRVLIQLQYSGSAVLSIKSNITMNACTLTGNANTAILFQFGTFRLNGSIVQNNSGGGIDIQDSTVYIYHSQFIHNECMAYMTCQFAALSIDNSTAGSEMSNCRFENNTSFFSGAIDLTGGSMSICDCTFVGNAALSEGGAIGIYSMKFNSSGYLILQNNAGSSVLIAVNSTLNVRGNTTVANNRGSLFVFYSNVTFSEHSHFYNNTYLLSPHQGYKNEYRSAITSFQSEIVFAGRATLLYNKGITGGALLAKESKVYFYGSTTIVDNLSLLGGGVYATQSTLTFMGLTNITGNVAREKGGGLHIAGTTTKLTGGSLEFFNNTAKHGGAISFEQNAKFYIVKPVHECLTYSIFCENIDPMNWLTLQFTNNSADYGGALYVNDGQNFGTCSTESGDCFFQTLAVYIGDGNTSSDLNFRNTIFLNNEARFAGNVIFGGLLDRCTVNSFAEILKRRVQFNIPTYLKPLSYLLDYNVTNLKRDRIQSEISSEPVRICFCHENSPDCSYQPPTLYVRKGERFSMSVVAVDQVNTTLPHTIIHSVVSPSAGLDEGQAAQVTNNSCTDLNYNVVSPQNYEHVQLYAEGPCKDSGISVVSFNVSFKACPIGFVDSESDCECDPDIYPDYISSCSINIESVLRKENIWITYVNTTDEEGFLTYSNCPYDYCYPPTEEVWINLNNPNSADNQCAYNHSGMLCGACKDGQSLTFGSSQCKQCSNNWLVLLIPFSIAGVALVAFLFVCNMTVDKATMNGVIFYANVVGTNRAILFPFESSKVLSIFIAWINLDFGFESCFFNGIDGYIKTWLQLVFPVYIIILVVLIIVVCEYSWKFQRLISRRRNPVAVLSTLILLSYTKFLRTIIAAFSFATLKYPNGSHDIVWLFDANVHYFSWKHTLLLMITALILILGLFYTLFLLVWQWIQGCPIRPCFRLINDTKLYAFMDAYQNPFNPKHRYWTGVLLLARVFLYLISAFNVNHDPGINLLSILCVAIVLFYVSNIPSKGIYKLWPLNILESSFLLNLILYSAVTLYVRGVKGDQTIVVYISIGIAFCTFVGIVLYHFTVFVLHDHLDKLKELFETCCNRYLRISHGAGRVNHVEFVPLHNVVEEENVDGPSYIEINALPHPVDTSGNDALLSADEEDTDQEDEGNENM